VLALAALSYYLACVLSLGYTDEAGRYLLPGFALAAPLLGVLTRSRLWTATALVLLFATLPGPLLHDDYKPVLALNGNPSIFDLNRLQQRTIDNGVAPLEPSIAQLNRLLGQRASLGFVGQDTFNEYLLFGETLQRRLIALSPDQITPATLTAQRLQGVFIAYLDQPPCSAPMCVPHRAGLRITPLNGGAVLVTVG
jgi:hypothetical protein